VTDYRRWTDGIRFLVRVGIFLFDTPIVFGCYCVFVCIYIGILAPLACFGL